MIRTIEGFHQDEVGDWVAELSCLHRQHVRHRPPFRDRSWVLLEAGRREHLGSEIDCPLCDRAELPDGLQVVRTAGPFDETTLPVGLQRAHRVGERTWGVLRVLAGTISFAMETRPPVTVDLVAGDTRAIPPGVVHALRPSGAVRVELDFLTRASPVEPDPEEGGDPPCWAAQFAGPDGPDEEGARVEDEQHEDGRP